VEKTNQLYVLPILTECYTITATFDLWMNKGANDIFALVLNFFGFDEQPKHITIRLFEIIETFGHALA